MLVFPAEGTRELADSEEVEEYRKAIWSVSFNDRHESHISNGSVQAIYSEGQRHGAIPFEHSGRSKPLLVSEGSY